MHRSGMTVARMSATLGASSRSTCGEPSEPAGGDRYTPRAVPT